MWWGRRTRVRFIRMLHDSGKLVEAEAFLPYQQQCANDSANHAGEKAIGSKITVDISLRMWPRRFWSKTASLKHGTNTRMQTGFPGISFVRAAPKGPKVLAP